MKIGIYNRYWNTFGGGEKYTATIAQILSEKHQVELISIEPIDWKSLQKRLGVDLSRCSMVEWPNAACNLLSYFSEGYDYFINSTYCSSIVPRSQKSGLICFFPHSLDNSLVKVDVKKTSYIKYYLKFFLRYFFSIVPIVGLQETDAEGRCIMGKASLFFMFGSINGKLKIPLWPDFHCHINKILVNGVSCNYEVKNNQLVIYVGGLLKIKKYAIQVFSETNSNDMTGFCIDTTKILWKNAHRDVEFALPQVSTIDALAAYSQILSISNFTTEWIDKRWALKSIQLPPPIDTDMFHIDQSVSRKPIILSVGRFFAGGHNKKHHEMVRAFIRIRAAGGIPQDWRLMLVGARHTEYQEHLDYFQSLEKLCEGHPIDIKPDLSFKELVSTYQQASIYLHAAGWGEDENEHPERMEHFGMTTCEAMACGCVPVVFDAAGQKEIVTDGITGFRFDSEAVLARHLQFLTDQNSREMLKTMSTQARQSIEQRYALRSFGDKLKGIFNE